MTAYGDDWVRLGERIVRTGFLVLEGKLHAPWGAAWEALGEKDFAEVLAVRPDVLLVGSGRRTRWLAEALRARFAEARVGLECMDTRAACRTYNLLATEGRRVALAALVPNA